MTTNDPLKQIMEESIFVQNIPETEGGLAQTLGLSIGLPEPSEGSSLSIQNLINYGLVGLYRKSGQEDLVEAFQKQSAINRHWDGGKLPPLRYPAA